MGYAARYKIDILKLHKFKKGLLPEALFLPLAQAFLRCLFSLKTKENTPTIKS